MERRSVHQETGIMPVRRILRESPAGMRGKGKPSPPVTQAVCRAVRLLECLAAGGREGLGITELSRELGFPKSTVHRILNTLTYEGYVGQQASTGRYDLTLKVLKLGAAVRRKLRLPYQARAHILQLMRSVDEAVTLAALEGDQLLIVDRIDRPERMNPGSDLGISLPLHCTAAGKAVLATLAPAAVERLLAGKSWERFTPYTLGSLEELLAQLEEFARLGYAIDRGEYRPGVKGVAAPIRDREGGAIAAVEVDVPIIRLTEERLEALALGVKDAAEKISIGLGSHRQEGL